MTILKRGQNSFEGGCSTFLACVFRAAAKQEIPFDRECAALQRAVLFLLIGDNTVHPLARREL